MEAGPTDRHRGRRLLSQAADRHRAPTAAFPRPTSSSIRRRFRDISSSPTSCAATPLLRSTGATTRFIRTPAGATACSSSDYHDQDLDAFGFRKVTIDLQQYVPIPDRYRTIALHAAAIFTDPRSGQDVPFYFEPTLGGAQALRGFREFRFQDRNSMLLTAEYRWEAWWALDGAVFVDAGQVANRRQDFRLSDFDVSYGVGFRIHSNSAFVARLDLAFSREGFIPLLRFEHAF